jgi:hypothetical protein
MIAPRLTHSENTMVTNTGFLRRVLAVDAIGTAALALAAVIAAGPLSAALGIPAPWFVGVGLLLLPFAAWVGSLARQINPRRRQVWLLIVGNDMWIAASLVLAFSGWLPLSELAAEFIVAQAALTATIATLEFIAIRRTSDSIQSFA